MQPRNEVDTQGVLVATYGMDIVAYNSRPDATRLPFLVQLDGCHMPAWVLPNRALHMISRSSCLFDKIVTCSASLLATFLARFDGLLTVLVEAIHIGDVQMLQ